ncbi:MAG: Cell division protein FtsZ [Parcubacteria group bacterium GW2011_GWA1_48_11b]|uniref:Cell division protein FtsZ n=1 Tax=Candidatus Harrisonbacteria bacterium RIFCSPHIGHO2_12_FULL_48_16 TaxID=1798405 RepID=A0A1G1ZLF0_9BACT|nr:MAG: Cell division protein FtsZ [Parcubacteria group bacterium GW2011_GWA1_48_11b]OGY64956.1 MAG: cell division protein FtsZ [Candidatus Harrisonbacteria bacterium RIFCSPHIGHO2_12_FULL_48_16]
MSSNRKSLGDYSAKIKVIGVGGGGGNAVSRMQKDFQIKSVDFIAINTDAQDLDFCVAKHKIYIGKNLTRGLGTGMNPELGRQAAEENRSEIIESLKGADLVFITAGLGGGTGSGASPIIAEAAKEIGALTVAIVTKPFVFEGAQRSKIAQEAFIKLKEKVDTLIVIPNDRIFSVIKKETPMMKAFEYIDDVLRYSVQGIAELIAMPGIINVDFADVRTIMRDAGSALVGIGLGSGQERAITAVNQAVNSPLLEVSIDGAKGLLFAVSGGKDLRLNEINDVAKIIGESVDPSARIIFGAYHDRKLKKGTIKVILIATGFNGSALKNGESSIINSLFSKPPIAEEVIIRNPAMKESEAAVAEKNAKENKKEQDVWDIPTFLRKKK